MTVFYIKMESVLLFIVHELVFPSVMLFALCFIYVKFVSVNYFIRNKSKQNVLLITAHPDDECMFFAPTILSLLREGHHLYLVCLSKGDFNHIGETRKTELQASCNKLGILPNHLTIVDDDRFKDGPDTVWDIDGIGERILAVVKRVTANSIITFDNGGVSGHANHIAIYRAVEKLCKGGELGEIAVFTLKSTNIVRKYISFLDIPVSSIFCMTSFVSLPSEVIKSWRAMAAHGSQFVWFRKLYIIFSRYMFVNTLKEIR